MCVARPGWGWARAAHMILMATPSRGINPGIHPYTPMAVIPYGLWGLYAWEGGGLPKLLCVSSLTL